MIRRLILTIGFSCAVASPAVTQNRQAAEAIDLAINQSLLIYSDVFIISRSCNFLIPENTELFLSHFEGIPSVSQDNLKLKLQTYIDRNARQSWKSCDDQLELTMKQLFLRAKKSLALALTATRYL